VSSVTPEDSCPLCPLWFDLPALFSRSVLEASEEDEEEFGSEDEELLLLAPTCPPAVCALSVD
jgi:hypothetical protein